MSYVLQIDSSSKSYKVEFLTKPSYSDVESAIRSFTVQVAKYADEDGDLCTLTENTFDNFLTTAQQKQGDQNVLRLQVPADESGSSQECPSSPSPSQCSSISSAWALVEEDDLNDLEDPSTEDKVGEEHGGIREAQRDRLAEQESLSAEPAAQDSTSEGQQIADSMETPPVETMLAGGNGKEEDDKSEEPGADTAATAAPEEEEATGGGCDPCLCRHSGNGNSQMEPTIESNEAGLEVDAAYLFGCVELGVTEEEAATGCSSAVGTAGTPTQAEEYDIAGLHKASTPSAAVPNPSEVGVTELAIPTSSYVSKMAEGAAEVLAAEFFEGHVIWSALPFGCKAAAGEEAASSSAFGCAFAHSPTGDPNLAEPSPAEAEASVAEQSSSCKKCFKPLELQLPGPFQEWTCDRCHRHFERQDPLWCCPTAKTCDWGLCMGCYYSKDEDVCHDRPRESSEDQTTCSSSESTSSFPDCYGVLGALLLAGPLLALPVALAAGQKKRKACSSRS